MKQIKDVGTGRTRCHPHRWHVCQAVKETVAAGDSGPIEKIAAIMDRGFFFTAAPIISSGHGSGCFR